MIEHECLELFSQAVDTFVPSLSLTVQRGPIHSGVRTFLHRMIIVLGPALLPIIPGVVDALLATPRVSVACPMFALELVVERGCKFISLYFQLQIGDLQEFVAFFNHLNGKFKSDMFPVLNGFFHRFVQVWLLVVMVAFVSLHFATNM